MAWAGRFAGRYNAEAEYWKQRVSSENLAKKNFEIDTGNVSVAKYFQGSARDQVMSGLRDVQ